MEFLPSISSGEQNSNGIIYTVPSSVRAFLTGLQITAGSADATVILYDNTAASGKVMARITVKSADKYGGRTWPFPVRIVNGIYLSITGTGALAIIEYMLT